MSIKDDYLIIEEEVVLGAIEEDEKAQQAKAINKLDFLLLKKAIFDKEFYSTNDSLTYLVRLLDVLPYYDGFRYEHQEVETIAKSIKCRDMFAISKYKSLLLDISSAKRQMFSIFGNQAKALITKIQKEKMNNAIELLHNFDMNLLGYLEKYENPDCEDMINILEIIYSRMNLPQIES